MEIGFIGAGNMARALARGLGDPVLATDSGSGRAAELVAELGGEAVAGGNAALARRVELLLLCHKPAQLEAVAGEVGDVFAGVVVSVLAGVSSERLRAAYPGAAAVVRAMPNTAVEVRDGVTCLAAGDGNAVARELFERVGLVVELPERLLDVATAVSGVAPAYVALVAEAWIDAAIRHGLPAGVAAELVGASIGGSATLLRARGMDTLAVRRGVTSPSGVTARGLAALEQAGVRAAFAKATDEVLR